jgi:hypothetical protein
MTIDMEAAGVVVPALRIRHGLIVWPDLHVACPILLVDKGSLSRIVYLIPMAKPSGLAR